MSQPSANTDLRQKGKEALKAGRLDDAVEAFSRCLGNDANDVEAQTLLGVAYSQKGLHDPALKMLDRAVQMQPGAAAIHYNRGLVLERAGRTAEAVKAFQDTLRLNPQAEPARQRLQALGQAPAPLNPPSPPGVPGVMGAAAPAAYGAPPPPPTPSAPAGAYAPPPSAPAYVPPSAGYVPPPPPPYAPPPPPPVAAAGYAPPGGAAPAAGYAPPVLSAIGCPRCGKQTQAGMFCQWCSAPLPPTPQAAPAVSAPPPAVYGQPHAFGAATTLYGGAIEVYATGEAFFRRLVAVAIDYGLGAGLIIFAALIGQSFRSSAGETNPGGILFTAAVMLYLGLQWFLLGSKGQSIGKMLLGLRVIGPDGDTPGYWRAYRRYRVQSLSIVCLGLGCLWMLWDADQQTWHDKWAGTRVVRA